MYPRLRLPSASVQRCLSLHRVQSGRIGKDHMPKLKCHTLLRERTSFSGPVQRQTIGVLPDDSAAQLGALDVPSPTGPRVAVYIPPARRTWVGVEPSGGERRDPLHRPNLASESRNADLFAKIRQRSPVNSGLRLQRVR